MNFHDEVVKLLTQSEIDTSNYENKDEFSYIYDEYNKNLIKLDKRQKEMMFSLEEITETMQELHELESNQDELTKEIELLLRSLISIIDILEDFYLYSKENLNENVKNSEENTEDLENNLKTNSNDTELQVFLQAEMLWNSVLKRIGAVGLSRIYDEKTKPDVKMNTIISTSFDASLPEGYIIHTLRSGYIYKNKVIRKSEVVVNKN